MIDLHSHFLPMMDDGAADPAESLAMLSDAYSQGVRICTGTSHATIHRDDSIETFIKRREESIGILDEAVKSGNVVIPELVFGAEIYLDNDISQSEGVGRLCIGDSNYLLVELSTGSYNRHYPEWLHNLNVKGFIPIIAHVERYPYLSDLTCDLDGLQVVYQINAETLLSRSGRKLLSKYYKQGVAIVVSSDMHNTRSRRCCMKAAYIKTKKHFPDIVDKIFERNQRKILNK